MATAQLQREKAAPSRPAGPICPAGRIEVTGIVLSTKILPDAGFGPSRKMLVELENGSRIYGTGPLGVDKGHTVVMKATIKPSVDDPTFGTFTVPKIISSRLPVSQQQQEPATAARREHWYQKA